jgi:hypothetical protein
MSGATVSIRSVKISEIGDGLDAADSLGAQRFENNPEETRTCRSITLIPPGPR